MVKLEFGEASFSGGLKKTGESGEKVLVRSKVRINNKLNAHMTRGRNRNQATNSTHTWHQAGIKTRLHWWETRAVPSLLPIHCLWKFQFGNHWLKRVNKLQGCVPRLFSSQFLWRQQVAKLNYYHLAYLTYDRETDFNTKMPQKIEFSFKSLAMKYM